MKQTKSTLLKMTLGGPLFSVCFRKSTLFVRDLLLNDSMEKDDPSQQECKELLIITLFCTNSGAVGVFRARNGFLCTESEIHELSTLSKSDHFVSGLLVLSVKHILNQPFGKLLFPNLHILKLLKSIQQLQLRSGVICCCHNSSLVAEQMVYSDLWIGVEEEA